MRLHKSEISFAIFSGLAPSSAIFRLAKFSLGALRQFLGEIALDRKNIRHVNSRS